MIFVLIWQFWVSKFKFWQFWVSKFNFVYWVIFPYMYLLWMIQILVCKTPSSVYLQQPSCLFSTCRMISKIICFIPHLVSDCFGFHQGYTGCNNKLWANYLAWQTPINLECPQYTTSLQVMLGMVWVRMSIQSFGRF